MSGGSSRRQIGTASVVLAIGLVGWNLGNFAFFVVAGHVLGPERYGFVAALLALVVAAFVPLSAFQPVAARPFAVGAADAPALARRAIRAALVIGVIALGTASAVVWIARLVVEDLPAWELTLTLASIVPIAPMFLALGVMQGSSRFRPITVTLVFWGASRPLALLVLSPLLDGVAATLLANLVGTAAAYGMAVGFTRAALRGGQAPPGDAWARFTGSLVGPLVGMSGLAVLFNVDVVVAKLFAEPLDAGYFGAVATLAKAGVVLAPQVLGIALLPQVAVRGAAGREVASLAALIVGAAVAVGALGVLVGEVGSRWIMSIYGQDFVPGEWMLAPAIAALIPLAVVFGLANYQIARGDDRYPRALAGVALLTVVALALAGRSVEAILAIEAAASVAAIALHEVIHRRDGSGLCRGVRLALGRVRRQSARPEP